MANDTIPQIVDTFAFSLNKSHIHNLPSSDVLNFLLAIVGTLVSTIGLFIGIYTLIKVKKVAKVQLEERNLTQELLDIDEIEMELSKISKKLDQINDNESKELAKLLSTRIGAIQGTRKAINWKTSIDKTIISNGFFNSTHLHESITKSKKELNIITGSTRIVSGYYELELLRLACSRDIKVCIIGIDPNSSNDILEDALLTVSNPSPKNADDYRKLINETIEIIKDTVEKWNDKEQANFAYYVYSGVPRLSFIQFDKNIDIGFLHFYREARHADKNLRPYIRTLASSDLGLIAIRHFEKALIMCKKIL